MFSLLKRIPVPLVALLIIPMMHLMYVLTKWYHIPLHDGVPVGQTDPDTWLRLTLVREWLMGGGWYNHLVPNSNAPMEAAASPWTRPVDVVLAFFVYLQPETIDINLRIMRASLLLPWLWMALLIAGIHRAVRFILPMNSAYVMATVLILTTPILLNYFGLGNADHHAPLAVLFIWAIGGILAPTQTRSMMIVSGILFGVQLWISVEAFMLIGAAYVWFGLQWLRGDSQKAESLAWLATATAFTSIIAIMIEVPRAEWFTPVYDSISIVYAYSLVIAALFAWGLRAYSPPTLQGRMIVGVIGGAIVALAIGAFYPHLPSGPLYGVHPFIITDFLPRISEAKSFFFIPIHVLIVCTYMPLMMIILCLAPWLRPEHSFYSREQSAKFAFFLIATLLLYYSQQRWSYYLLPLTIAIIAPLLGALFTPEHPFVAHHWPANTLVTLTPNEQMKRRLPVLLGALALPILFTFASDLPIFKSDTTDERTLAKQRSGCYNAARQLIRSGELNRVLPTPLTLWLPTDLATEILFFTPHSIIASNYHREGEAIKHVWDTNKITSAAALRAHLAKRNVGAMLICPMVEFPKGGLTQAFAMGARVPAWLTAVAYKLPAAPKKQLKADDVPLVKPVLVKVNTR